MTVSFCPYTFQREAVIWNIDESKSFDGGKSARLQYNSNVWTQSKPISITSESDDSLFTFSIYAKTEQDGIKGCLGVRETEWGPGTWGSSFTLTKNWKRYSVTAKLKKGTNDYQLCVRMRQPCIIWVDAFQLERGEKATEYRNAENCIGISIPSLNSYIFFDDEKIPISIAGMTKSAAHADYVKMSLLITDYNGNEVYRREINDFLKEDLFKKDYEFIPVKLGWFKITARFIKNEKVFAEKLAAFCVVKKPVKIENGMNVFCRTGHGYCKGIERIGGYHWVGTGIFWNKCESVSGQYEWPDISWIHEEGKKSKLTIMIFQGMPKWAWDPVDIATCNRIGNELPRYGFLPAQEHIESWRNFIKQLIVHYKGLVDAVEIGGEDDLAFGHNSYYLQKYPENVKSGFLTGGPAYERYIQLLKIACEEIRKVDPSIQIGIVRPSGVDCSNAVPQYVFSTPAIEACRDLFDIFPLDCYPSGSRYIGPDKPPTEIPEDFLINDLNKALNTCRINGKEQPVCVAEIGYALDYNVAPDSSYSLEIVKRLVRMFLLAKITPGCESLQWFTINHVIEGKKYHYGLWRFDMPMPTVPAFSMIARVIENTKEFKELMLGGESKSVVFKKDGQAEAAVWFVRGNGKLVFEKLPEDIIIYDVMGNPLPRPGFLEIGELPVYFSMKGNDSFDRLINILSGAKMVCVPIKLSFLIHFSNKGILRLQNLAGTDINADIVISTASSVNKKSIFIKKNQDADIDVPISQQHETIKVSADCGGGYSKVKDSYVVALECCPRIKFKGKIDGDLSKWSGHPFITMNERGQIMPPDPWIDWKGPAHFSAKIYIGWDDEYFYMLADVKDKIHCNKFPEAIYRGDSIQFAFSFSDNNKKCAYGKNDKELGFALVNEKVITSQWAGSGNVWEKTECIVKRDENMKKTIYEMRIPLQILNIKSLKGTVFGFNFVIFNDDTGTRANYWYQLSSGITSGKNPSLFKKFMLSE